MPLHLLSKKSWNVYGTANRARVARDEALAEAQARDDEQERRDGQSASTLAALRDARQRGPAQLSNQDKLLLKATKDLTASRKASKKRKRLPGEDDTDRDLRYAKERQSRRAERLDTSSRPKAHRTIDAPLVDAKGHTNLFPENKLKHERTRKSELQKEREQQRSLEEEQGMQFKDAWGRRNGRDAWYLDKDGAVKDAVGKDVWGNEDPRRQQRQAQRLISSDPLAFMKQAQSQLQEGRRERREREMDTHRARSREHRDIPRFSLDAQENNAMQRRHSRDREQHNETRRRHRSPPMTDDCRRLSTSNRHERHRN